MSDFDDRRTGIRRRRSFVSGTAVVAAFSLIAFLQYDGRLPVADTRRVTTSAAASPRTIVEKPVPKSNDNRRVGASRSAESADVASRSTPTKRDDGWSPQHGSYVASPHQRLVSAPAQADESSPTETPSRRGTDKESPTDKTAIPNADAQKAKRSLIEELYRGEYEQARTQGQRRELSKKMFQHALATKSDPAGKYVLLIVAGRIATAAGEVDVALQSIDAIAKEFDSGVEHAEHHRNVLERKRDALRTIADTSTATDLHEQVVRHSLAAVQDASRQFFFDLAGEFSRIAVESARKTRDKSLSYEAIQVSKHIQAATEAFEDFKDDWQTLKESPGDPIANGNVGRFVCFNLGGWEQGLPMLASGDDATLRRLATLEMETPEAAELQVELADGWWQLAEDAISPARERLLERASFWYRQAAPQLEGLPRQKALARAGIDEASLQQQPPVEQRFAPDGAELMGPFQSAEEKIGRSSEVTNSIGMQLRLIPAGEFLMGSRLRCPRCWSGISRTRSIRRNAIEQLRSPACRGM